MKLYRPATTEYQAKAQKSVMLAGSVICLGICMAFTVLSVDMFGNGHTLAGVIIAIPALAAFTAGVAFIAARSKYGRDLKKLRMKSRDEQRDDSNTETQEGPENE